MNTLIFLGRKLMKEMRLWSKRFGYNRQYNPTVNPSIQVLLHCCIQYIIQYKFFLSLECIRYSRLSFWTWYVARFCPFNKRK